MRKRRKTSRMGMATAAKGPRGGRSRGTMVIALVLLGAGLSLWAADYRLGRPTARPVLRHPSERGDLLEAPGGGGRYLSKPIEQLAVGDQVVTQDPRTGARHLKRVLRIFERHSTHLRRLRVRAAAGLRTQWIETTDEHPFWVPGRGWVPAGKLQVGDRLRQADGQAATLVDVAFEKTPGGVPVFNIETDEFHTYFVAADDRSAPLLVHNCNPESLGKLYHYTTAAPDRVLRHGLRTGASGKVFLTPNGTLSPLQAHLGLALPPNRGLPQHVLEIDLKTLRELGLEVSELRQVGRRYNLPGGELEATVGADIPPAAIRPLR